MRREDGIGEGDPVEWRGRVESDVGAPFGGSIARYTEGRAYETTGVRARCSDPSKNCSARTSSDAGDGKEACAGTGVASVQGRPRGEGQAMGRQHKKQMAVEEVAVPEP